jgi:hypothetical protein
MAVAILAIVIALSSSATAALMISGAQIKNGSVAGKDIKNKSVTGKDIKKKAIGRKHLKKGSVTSKSVLDRSLTGSDLRLGTLTGEHLRDGSLTVSQLSQGVIDTLGNGVGGFQVVTATSPPTAPLSNATISGSCPAGKVALSANAYWLGPNLASPQLRRTSTTAFQAQGPNPLNIEDSIQIQVTCVNA